MKREEIYKAIDSEREYQDKMSLSKYHPDMIEDMHLGDILSAINYNFGVAQSWWYSEAEPYEKSMEYIRKIAGLCVKAGEQFGMKKREI